MLIFEVYEHFDLIIHNAKKNFDLSLTLLVLLFRMFGVGVASQLLARVCELLRVKITVQSFYIPWIWPPTFTTSN